MSRTPHIGLGVTGSIAAYKAVELVRLMTGRNWKISVMMTEAATRYVGPLTFQALTGQPVAVGSFGGRADKEFPHIDLGQEADVLLIAPCTANTMAKLACGLADDIISCTVLASQAPVIVAPAMNVNMWNNPATQANRQTLIDRGVNVLDTGEGELACGMVGAGRLIELEDIVSAVAASLP